jgi:hypothetical protein
MFDKNTRERAKHFVEVILPTTGIAYRYILALEQAVQHAIQLDARATALQSFEDEFFEIQKDFHHCLDELDWMQDE